MFGLGNKEPEKRVALVIGNADYLHVSDLPNASHDAITIADKLKQLGFTVIFRLDQSVDELDLAAETFHAAMAEKEGCDVALLYYAGHGVQLDGDNYIVPTDFNRKRDGSQSKLFKVQTLMDAMSRNSKRNLIFLDACRDRGGIDPNLLDNDGNAQPEFEGGLGKIPLKRDEHTFVAFAADPGDVAEDGIPKHGSPFTNAVAHHITTRAVDLHDVLQWVANDVRNATDGRQRPWSYSNLSGEFHLAKKSWLPTVTLLLLGGLTGFLNAWLSYDAKELLPHNVYEKPHVLLYTLLFGIVLGAGVYFWGRKTLWAAAITVVTYAVFATWSRLIVARVVNDKDSMNAIKEIPDIQTAVQTPDVIALLLVIILAGALAGFASVFSGAITSRALRPVTRLSLGMVLGAFSAALYLTFISFRSSLPDWAAGWELIVIYINATLWQAGLGANVGWAYTHDNRRKEY